MVITFHTLATELGIKQDTLAYHVKHGRIPQWGMFGHQRVYTPEQAETVRQFWRSRKRYERAKVAVRGE